MQPRNWAAAAPAQGSRKCRTPPRGCAPRPSAPCHRGTNVCRVGHPAPRVGAAEAPSPGLRPVHACACSRGNGQQLRWHDMPWPGAAAGCQAAVQMRMRAHPSASAARRRRTACTPAGGRHAGTPHMLGARACRSCPPQRRRRHATRGPPRPRRPPRRRRPAQRPAPLGAPRSRAARAPWHAPRQQARRAHRCRRCGLRQRAPGHMRLPLSRPPPLRRRAPSAPRRPRRRPAWWSRSRRWPTRPLTGRPRGRARPAAPRPPAPRPRWSACSACLRAAGCRAAAASCRWCSCCARRPRRPRPSPRTCPPTAGCPRCERRPSGRAAPAAAWLQSGGGM